MYTIGQFARLAQVTTRTLRFYDQKGLLKPSHVSEAGYRMYQPEDLITLQKILLFKKLGFSLDEISYLLIDGSSDLLQSLHLQSDLVAQRILHLRALQDSLLSAIQMVESGRKGEDRILDLVKILGRDDELVEQYKNAKNLQIRIRLHEKYSQNPVGWFDWLFSHIDFSRIMRLLEIGCGNGELWKNKPVNTRHREIFLSDISMGMVSDARSSLDSEEFSFMTFSAEEIPFRRDYFDAVIANHVLFYIANLNRGLKEIARVLKEDGILYASAYGKGHMAEITHLVQEFDPRIILSSKPLYDAFGIENGKQILETWFEQVEFIRYEDRLEVDSAQDLGAYILSCHGNQNEYLLGRYEEFLAFLQKKIDTDGKIIINKDVGFFKAEYPRKEK